MRSIGSDFHFNPGMRTNILNERMCCSNMKYNKNNEFKNTVNKKKKTPTTNIF